MAFKDTEVGIHVSSTGTGGIVTYYAADDALSVVQGASFWDRDLSAPANARHLRARKAVEDFIRSQTPLPQSGNANQGGVIMGIVGNANAATGASSWRRARLLASGRVTTLGF